MEIDYTYKPLTDAQKKDKREKGVYLRYREIGHFVKEYKKGKSNKMASIIYNKEKVFFT